MICVSVCDVTYYVADLALVTIVIPVSTATQVG